MKNKFDLKKLVEVKKLNGKEYRQWRSANNFDGVYQFSDDRNIIFFEGKSFEELEEFLKTY